MPAQKFKYPFKERREWRQGGVKPKSRIVARVWRTALKTRPKYAFALILSFSFVSMALMMYSLSSFRDDAMAAEKGIALDHGFFFDDIVIDVRKSQSTKKPAGDLKVATGKPKKQSLFLDKLVVKSQ